VPAGHQQENSPLAPSLPCYLFCLLVLDFSEALLFPRESASCFSLPVHSVPRHKKVPTVHTCTHTRLSTSPGKHQKSLTRVAMAGSRFQDTEKSLITLSQVLKPPNILPPSTESVLLSGGC
jgi:hypothetical protein